MEGYTGKGVMELPLKLVEPHWVIDANGKTIAAVSGGGEGRALPYIVHCCNNYGELVDALERCQQRLSLRKRSHPRSWSGLDQDAWDTTRAILDKCKGE